MLLAVTDGSEERPRQLFTGRRWFVVLLGLGNAVAALGFLWALVDGWDGMPGAVAIPFLLACVVVLVGAGFALVERKRDRH